MTGNLLSLAIWLPIVAGLVVLATGGDKNAPAARWLALAGALVSFLVTIPLYTGFDTFHGGMQFTEMKPWVESFNINYHLGVDGLSMLFVILNSFTTLLVVLAGWQVIEKRVAQYMAAFLIMSGLINGAFAALDAILFYAFFEAMLIPMYLIIGVWGGANRVYASVKFFLYTLMGSLLTLVAFIYLYYQSGGSFEIAAFQRLPLTMGAQTLLLIAFFFAFAVKVPMWPVHTWLPDAHVEAPTGGSMVLAAITLKLGAYGFLRFVLPIAPDASREYAWVMVALSLVAVVYIGMVALVQTDMKKLVAYSSISHMGFVTLGFFMFGGATGRELNSWAVEGALVQMVSHGFVSAAMFFCIGVMYDRLHSRKIADYGGVANKMPIFAAFMMLFAMANSGLPATSGFVGEFMVILGAVQINFWYALAGATTLIFGAAYTLWMYKRVIFGEVANENVAELKDVNKREFLILAILAIAVLGMGLYPAPFTEVMHQSVNDLIWQVSQTKLN
ncbi:MULTISPECIES: NADH-quinone oxidoreductase subunit M [Deefgea]|uniref:NADH-quinone oxidoreductase subunit M n=1 Tax=Deefgea chitinilytica TaxID=570276 RepID=A0ABS2CCH9_9NEIS|nr:MULTISPECIES: NADH-quinone oxidoreductase subunit M [Deefgea]MBM5571163.1 NADH-quinone oxidoreductase subunit M [Deefgea chitinilytica]MBM9888395.1 NADH-quinone oxidoreductase subunit M [Deefgea sp. CFH1-16]